MTTGHHRHRAGAGGAGRGGLAGGGAPARTYEPRLEGDGIRRPPGGFRRRAHPGAGARAIAGHAAHVALRAALRLALRSLETPGASKLARSHKALAAVAGAAGGALGLAALPIELPASTIVMFRAIADIAREEGEDLADPATGLACLEVFALGGRSMGVEAGEAGYFAVRSLLARSVSEATRYVVERSVVDEAAPALVRFISQIASRFGLVVGQKVAAQSVPILGAIGGAAVNYAFMDHFQALARGHFTVRRLERAYGPEPVRREFDRLKAVGV